MNSYYGDNLLIEWDGSNSASLEQVTAFKYRVVGVVPADSTVVYKWTESYRPR